MSRLRRISLSVSISVGTTLVCVRLVSIASGIAVPGIYWAVATLCPLVLSTVISGRRISQEDELRRLYAELQEAHAQ